MSIPFSKFVVKHQYANLPENVRNYIQSKTTVHNGHYYVLPIDCSIHYDALKRKDMSIYDEYMTTLDNTHTKDSFQHLLDTFDIKRIGKIQVNLYGHSNMYWVQDGVHRLSILKAKQIFGDAVPIEFLDISIYKEVEDQLKNSLKKTVGHGFYNHWHNRLEFGYHSFDLFTFRVQGQRNPKQRFEKIRRFYDFTNKNVLDLGCNTGGMLFHIPEIARGVGVDYDQTCIDSCCTFRDRLMFACRLDFYKHDLNNFSCVKFCDSIQFKPDIIFLLSLGSWVEKWKVLYKEAFQICNTILLEINNVTEGGPQLEFFEKELGAKLTLISDKSDDDCTGNHGRRTYLVEKQTKPLVLLQESRNSSLSKGSTLEGSVAVPTSFGLLVEDIESIKDEISAMKKDIQEIKMRLG